MGGGTGGTQGPLWIELGVPSGDKGQGQLVEVGACLCGNVYIVGLNQLEDVAIDINHRICPWLLGVFKAVSSADCCNYWKSGCCWLATGAVLWEW